MVNLKHQDLWSDSHNQMKKMAGSSSQDGGGAPEDFKIIAALFVSMPTHYLYLEM